MEMSHIVNFFEDSSVLLTGATGFLGKLFLERLLRVCGVRIVFILIRSKKGVSDDDRFAQLFDKPPFARLKSEVPDFRSRVVLIRGDCAVPNLGVSDLDWMRLIREVNVVLHCAATVRFDQTLRLAYNINVRAISDLLDKCTLMPQLKSIICISTAYTNCTRKLIGEEVYPPPMTDVQLFPILDAFHEKDDIIERMTPGFLGPWPNTYTLTKCIAEEMVQRKAVKHNLPLSIVRPSMVMPSFKQPIPGWTDNFYGPIGVTFAAALGFLRTLHCVPELRADMVPVDYVVSAILAAAWSTAEEHSADHPRSKVKVYNYVSDDLSLNWKTYRAKTSATGEGLQTMRTIWPFMFRLNRYELVHRLSCLFLHTVPAHLVDYVARLIGRPPQMVDICNKTNKFINAIEYFSTREWRFDTANVDHLWTKLNSADHELFEFRMTTFDWDEYIPDFIKGGRVFLLNDPLSTIPAALRRYRNLVLVSWVVKIALVLLAYAIFRFMFRLVL